MDIYICFERPAHSRAVCLVSEGSNPVNGSWTSALVWLSVKISWSLLAGGEKGGALMNTLWGQ